MSYMTIDDAAWRLYQKPSIELPLYKLLALILDINPADVECEYDRYAGGWVLKLEYMMYSGDWKTDDGIPSQTQRIFDERALKEFSDIFFHEMSEKYGAGPYDRLPIKAAMDWACEQGMAPKVWKDVWEIECLSKNMPEEEKEERRGETLRKKNEEKQVEKVKKQLKVLAAAIALYRKNPNLTRNDLAAKLSQELNISQHTINKYWKELESLPHAEELLPPKAGGHS